MEQRDQIIAKFKKKFHLRTDEEVVRMLVAPSKDLSYDEQVSLVVGQ